jgi:hypothetical protein
MGLLHSEGQKINRCRLIVPSSLHRTYGTDHLHFITCCYRRDLNVWTTKKRVEKLRYMHRNPVKRGLVNLPEQWRWSSYRFYFLDEAGPVRVNEDWGKISFQAPVA